MPDFGSADRLCRDGEAPASRLALLRGRGGLRQEAGKGRRGQAAIAAATGPAKVITPPTAGRPPPPSPPGRGGGRPRAGEPGGKWGSVNAPEGRGRPQIGRILSRA